MAEQFQTGQELRVMEIRTKIKGGTFEITEVQREPQNLSWCLRGSAALPCPQGSPVCCHRCGVNASHGLTEPLGLECAPSAQDGAGRGKTTPDCRIWVRKSSSVSQDNPLWSVHLPHNVPHHKHLWCSRNVVHDLSIPQHSCTFPAYLGSPTPHQPISCTLLCSDHAQSHRIKEFQNVLAWKGP